MPIVPPVPPAPLQLNPLVGLKYSGTVDKLRISNGLVRVTGNPVSNPTIEFWDTTAWRLKAVDILVNGAVGGWTSIGIVENRLELCTVRYERGEAGGGRVTLDLSLRRGMRGVIGYLTRHASATLGIRNGEASPAMTVTAERMRQNAASADGHRLVFTTAKSYSSVPSTGEMTKAAVTAFDFVVSLELASPVAGDAAAELSMQAMGYLNETTRAVRR